MPKTLKLLVTGGAGFIGSHFVRTVLADEMPGLEGARITVLDKLAYAGTFDNLGVVAESDRLDFVPGDICDAALVGTLVPKVDAIVHAAASDSGDAMTDVVGTQVLLDAALRHGLSRFLHVSTDEVYGSIGTGAWTERSPVAPNTIHGATRAGADLLALAHHRAHGLPVVVTRCADNYGPYQRPSLLVPRVVTGHLRGQEVPAGGDRTRDWVHVDDHCRGLALALTAGKAGEIYHIGGTGMSGRDLTERLLSLCGAHSDRVASPATNGDRHALDDDKIRRELGYRPRVELDDGLAATVQWYRDHEDWWRPLIG